MQTKTPLRLAREKQGLTIQQVAAAIRVNQSNVSRIECGKQTASKRVAELLSAFFKGALTETEIIYPERYMKNDEAAQ